MKNSIIVLFFFILHSCAKPEISIGDMDPQAITNVNITSVKKLKEEVYYTMDLKLDSKTIEYDYDDNRDVIIGDFVKDMGVMDAAGSIDSSESKLRQLWGKLKTLSNKSTNEGLIETTVDVFSENGKCKIVTSDLFTVQEFERFVQSSLLKNKAKILMN